VGFNDTVNWYIYREFGRQHENVVKRVSTFRTQHKLQFYSVQVGWLSCEPGRLQRTPAPRRVTRTQCDSPTTDIVIVWFHVQ